MARIRDGTKQWPSQRRTGRDRTKICMKWSYPACRLTDWPSAAILGPEHVAGGRVYYATCRPQMPLAWHLQGNGQRRTLTGRVGDEGSKVGGQSRQLSHRCCGGFRFPIGPTGCCKSESRWDEAVHRIYLSGSPGWRTACITGKLLVPRIQTFPW